MRKTCLFASLVLAVGAEPAVAHSPVPGVEGFYVGLLHPYSTPSQAILILGLGLLVGAFSMDRVRWLLVGFLIASVIGLIAGFRFSDLDVPMFALGFATCAIAALLPGKLLTLAGLSVIVGGFLIGDASIPDAGPVSDRVFTMTGSIVGANLGLLYLFGALHFITERFKQAWVSIAFRVAAAWLGAIALLMLALEFATSTPPA